jgi:hypothetical protein
VNILDAGDQDLLQAYPLDPDQRSGITPHIFKIIFEQNRAGLVAKIPP